MFHQRRLLAYQSMLGGADDNDGARDDNIGAGTQNRVHIRLYSHIKSGMLWCGMPKIGLGQVRGRREKQLLVHLKQGRGRVVISVRLATIGGRGLTIRQVAASCRASAPSHEALTLCLLFWKHLSFCHSSSTASAMQLNISPTSVYSGWLFNATNSNYPVNNFLVPHRI